MPGVPRAAILRLMLKRSLLALPAIAGAALLATRLVPGQGLVAVVGNLSDSVYFLDAATLERRGSVAVGHRPYTAVSSGSNLYISDWGDSTVSVVDLSTSPPEIG